MMHCAKPGGLHRRLGGSGVICDRHTESENLQFALDIRNAAAFSSVQLPSRVIDSSKDMSDLVQKFLKLPDGLQIVQLYCPAAQEICDRADQIIRSRPDQLSPGRNSRGISAISDMLEDILRIVKRSQCLNHFAGIASQKCQLPPQSRAIGITIGLALSLCVTQLNSKYRDTAANSSNRAHRLNPARHEIGLIRGGPEGGRTSERYQQDRDHSNCDCTEPTPCFHIAPTFWRAS